MSLKAVARFRLRAVKRERERERVTYSYIEYDMYEPVPACVYRYREMQRALLLL